MLTYINLNKANNIGTDQTARMDRLVCAYVVRNNLKTGFLASRPINMEILWPCACLQPRTKDSLNKGLPIKMTREKFQRKLYFFYEKDSWFNPRLIYKSHFLIGQVPIEKIWVENSVFAIQHIENRKKFY